MVALERTRDRNEDLAIRELEEALGRSIPSLEDLEKAVERLAPGVELSKDERVTVLRNLERVWHILRLLKLLSEYFGDSVCFGGGSVLNYFYMVEKGEVPRFTFDLDVAWRKPARAKREILSHIPLFNRWLAEKGYSYTVPVGGGRFARLWVVGYDVEKDFFPDVLSLRVPVLTRYTGEPFYRFLRISDYRVVARLREVFKRVLGTGEALVDYVRLEVSLGLHEAPVVVLDAESPFGDRVRALVTEPELQAAWKILHKVGKRFEDPRVALHDVLKAVLDLRLAKHLDTERIKSHVLASGKPVEELVENSERNIKHLEKLGRELWRGHHYVLVRKSMTLEEASRRALNTIHAILQ